MKQTSIDAIRTALSILLAELQKTDIPQEAHWVYARGDGGWRGSLVPRPGGYSLLSPHQPLIDRLSSELSPVLTADYPDYMTKPVGLGGLGGGILQPQRILHVLAHESLKRFGAFAIGEEQVNALLNDATRFFDSPNVRIRLFAPLLNVHGSRDVPPINFPGDIIMRPISDEEFTQFYGGNPIFGTSRLVAYPDFVFVRELEVTKIIFDSTRPVEQPFYKSTQDMLDRCILAISSFKDGGAVGYDGLRVTAAELALGVGFGGQHLWGNEHVPLGRYELGPEEAPKLEAYAMLFEKIHPTLEMACQRLVDAARRTKPRDSIVDVVIGLESVLLVGGDKREQGEKRFRFSLNYASLFPPSEREAAFYTARDLYDLRSEIAHGGEPKGKVKFGGKEISLHEIASLARSMLRETLAKFMPKSSEPDFLAERYWMARALGL